VELPVVTNSQYSVAAHHDGRVNQGRALHQEVTRADLLVALQSEREIDRKFDEIVEFSGVERFLDTPVKRYSSGMQVRG
jgi:ABC-type polysaccharide/polyol phosphate transport system ATPase subunit